MKSFNDVYVVVPSYCRPDRQITVSELQRANIPYTVVLSEMDRTAKQYVKNGHDIIVAVGKAGTTIARKRQWIIENIGPKVIMLDDDLTFRARSNDNRFLKATSKQINAMFKKLAKRLDTFAHVGIADEFMCNARPPGETYVGRYNQVVGYNSNLFPDNPRPRFRFEFSEEHDFHLQLLTAGLRPCILNDWTKHTKGYNAEGGVSNWRTAERERKAHEQIARTWPGIAEVKTTKHSVSGTRISIRWSKATKTGEKK